MLLGAAQQSWDASRRARRAVRRAQLAGDGARSHGHDLLPDGLRHHRHRARPRAREDEEAGRWRDHVDRQPDDAAGARSPRLHAVPDRQHRRLHRRQHVDRRRTAPEGRAPSGVRVLDGRQRHPLHGPRADDGGRAAVHQRRDIQDDQHARVVDGRGRRGHAHGGLEARPQGRRHLPRQLQGRAAALDDEEGSRCGHRRCDAEATAAGTPTEVVERRSSSASSASPFARSCPALVSPARSSSVSPTARAS